MDIQNRKIISIIVFLKKFVSVFFNIFFNIYVLKIVDDIGFVIKLNLFRIILEGLFSIFISSILTNKNAKFIYNSSFIQLVICIALLLFLKEKICDYIYIFTVLRAFQSVCYAIPYEMVIMGSNSNKTMSSFLANVNILSYIATILTPIFSGFIIEKFSYNMLFLLLTIESMIIMIISMRITSFYIGNDKIKLKKFWNKSKNYPHLKNIYNCMFYRRISYQGAITDLLPILLFLKVGSELSVGSYNSLFAIVSISSLIILKYINKKNVNKKFYIIFSCLIFLSSIILVIKPNFVTLIIYYLFINSLGSVIESESCSLVYESINVDDLNEYKREHDITFNIYMLIGQTISYSFAYILYIFFYNENIISISICILMLFSIIACIYLQKVEKYLFMKRNLNK